MARRLSALLVTLSLAHAPGASQPPAEPPAEFAQPQSPQLPPPFPVKYVDQGTYDPKLKGLLAPEGFRVELVADAPTVVNPVGMTFTPDGTLIVMEWKPDPGREWYEFKETFRYRDGTTKTVATMKKFTPDVVKTLQLNRRTNTYDKAEVILTDELPSSVLYHDGWIYLSGRGTVRRYRQTQPNGKWDLRETIAHGFCGFHHHQVSGMTIGPDGWLYLTSGDDDNFVEGSDGSRATVLRTGAVFRCRPDGSHMETYSLGYRNPYRDLAFDAKYNWFHADNDNEDGSRFTGCRLVHVAEEVDYGWRLLEGARCCRPDHVRGAVAGERPGKLQPMLKTGRGSPAGVLIYNDTQLPEQYRGLMFYPDVFRKSVRAYSIAPTGSTFDVTHEFDFLKSDDPLFRPCQMVTGPDGAIYVCDWRTDSGGAGKLWGDGTHGRIYRVRWAGTDDLPEIPLRPMSTWRDHAGKSVPFEKVTAGCLSPDQTTRQHSLIELVRRGEHDSDRVRTWLMQTFRAKDDEGGRRKHPPEVRLLCLYALQQLWDKDAREVTLAALQDADADVRRVAADALGRQATATDFATNEALRKALGDEAPAVRRAAALAMGRLAADGAADALLTAWRNDREQDPFLEDAYVRAVERLGKRGITALLSLAESGDADALRHVAEAFTALRTPTAAAAIPELLANPHLTPRQKAVIVRSYTNYQFDPPLSLEPLAVFLASRPNEPAEVKTAGLDVLAAFGELGGGKGNEFVLGLLDSPEVEVRIAACRAIEAARVVSAVPRLNRGITDAKRGLAERSAFLAAGRAVGGTEVKGAVVGVLESPREAADLKVIALRTLATLDPAAARTFAESFLDQPSPDLIAESVAVLGATKEGAKLVGERYLAKRIPRDMFPRVSDVLRKHPGDDAIARLNAEVLRGGLLLSLEPAEVEKVRKKVATDGDPARGKAVYLNSAAVACATCHKMEGVGGAVGPDLTRVWDTMTVEKLLETIVTPSKEIKEGYQTYRLLTLSGQSFVGLKVADTPTEVTIREATGRDVKVPRADVDELTATKQSLMPDDVVSQLSYDQFIDLLAFLKSRSQQESLRGLVVSGSAVAGVSTDLAAVLPAETSADPLQRVRDEGQLAVDLTADTGGLFQLSSLAGGKPAGVLIVSYVYSPEPQVAKAALLADDAVRVSVGGKLALQRTVPKSAPFTQEETFDAPLQAGWNPVVVRSSSNGATHRVGLRFSGTDLRTAAKPEK